MLTDYKFKSIRRDGNTTKVVVAFYEGEITARLENTVYEGIKNVTAYRRSKLLKRETYELQGDVSEDKIRAFVNKELAKDRVRIPILQQNAQIL